MQVILKAAAQILERRGLAGFNTNCVAEAAGVSVGSLYQYFPNKQALLDAIYARHLLSSGAVVARLHADPPSSLREALRALLAGVVAAHLREPLALSVIIEAGASPSGRAVNEAARIALRTLLERYRREIARADLDNAAFVLVHVIEAVIHAALRDRLVALRDGTIGEELLELALGYLRRASGSHSKRRWSPNRVIRDDANR